MSGLNGIVLGRLVHLLQPFLAVADSSDWVNWVAGSIGLLFLISGFLMMYTRVFTTKR